MTTTEVTELGFITPIAVPKRPDKRSKEVQEAAAKELAEVLKEYWRSIEPMEEGEAFECALKIIDQHDHDGYRLAKFCEEEWSWDADSELVETLESTELFVYRAKVKTQKDWVKKYNVTVPYEVGQRVYFVMNRFSSASLKGEIKSIKAETAELTIKEDGCTQPNTIGYIIPVEGVLGGI